MKSNPYSICLLILAGAVVLYMFVVRSVSSSLTKTRSTLSETQIRLDTIEMNISQKSNMCERIGVLDGENKVLRAVWLTPLLNSYAMRAKALVDVIAAEAGLLNVEYVEGEQRALPAPKGPMPANRTARRSVTLHAMADYAAIASFLLRLEKELPQVTLQSLNIQQKPGITDRQDVEIVLEWPGKGEVIK